MNFCVKLHGREFTIERDADGKFILPEELRELKTRGTGLKPTFEPILVFRKPFKGTLVNNVLEHGTGALNIDGCRVKHSNPADFEKHKAGVEAIKARGGSMDNSWKNSSDLSGANDVTSAGRWPPNLIFTHAPGCHQVGAKKTKAIAPTGQPSVDAPRVRGVYGEGDPNSFVGNGSRIHYSDADGTETVEAWDCVPGCPVAELDAQSGNRPSTLTGRADPNASHENPGDNHGASWFGGGNSKVYADEGGASRFYPQFQEELEPVEVPFFYTPKVSKAEATLDGEIKNDHVTKKPLKLMRYLVRLATPKGGIVLDLYCGSGSTLHAAVEEGMRYTGIERDSHSHEIATKRMAIVHERAKDSKGQRDLFDLMMSGSLDDPDEPT